MLKDLNVCYHGMKITRARLLSIVLWKTNEKDIVSTKTNIDSKKYSKFIASVLGYLIEIVLYRGRENFDKPTLKSF